MELHASSDAVFVCCFVSWNKYWGIVTISGFPHEWAKGHAPTIDNRRRTSSPCSPWARCLYPRSRRAPLGLPLRPPTWNFFPKSVPTFLFDELFRENKFLLAHFQGKWILTAHLCWKKTLTSHFLWHKNLFCDTKNLTAHFLWEKNLTCTLCAEKKTWRRTLCGKIGWWRTFFIVKNLDGTL